MPQFFCHLVSLLLVCGALAVPSVQAAERVTVAYPGPYNVPLLPLDLAVKIGADRAEGLQLVPRHISGGGALKDLQTRNVDFAAPGIPAAMSARLRGSDVVLIAAMNDLPVYILAVRKDLQDVVKRPRDLAGRVVGVTSSSLTAKTTSHQVAELLLKGDGVPTSQIRIQAIGQNWEEISAAVKSQTVDAVVGFEPFLSRLRDADLASFVFNLAQPADAARIPGAGFLVAGLVTRQDVIERTPDTAARLVAVVRRTLEWMAQHSPEEIVAVLQIDDEDKRAALLDSLRRYPRLYSRDGRLSAQQIAETDRFFAAVESMPVPLTLGTMIDSRWAGSKP